MQPSTTTRQGAREYDSTSTERVAISRSAAGRPRTYRLVRRSRRMTGLLGTVLRMFR